MKANTKVSNEDETPPIENVLLAVRCFIVKFDNGDEPFYIANWEGDPGRTLLKVNAKQFRNQKVAEKALKKAVKDYPQRNLVGKVVGYNCR